MRFCRFNNDRLGVVRGDLVHDVTAGSGKAAGGALAAAGL